MNNNCQPQRCSSSKKSKKKKKGFVLTRSAWVIVLILNMKLIYVVFKLTAHFCSVHHIQLFKDHLSVIVSGSCQLFKQTTNVRYL